MHQTVSRIVGFSVGILGPLLLVSELAAGVVSRGIRSRKQRRLLVFGYIVPSVISLIEAVSEYAGWARIMGAVGWGSLLVVGVLVALRHPGQPRRDFRFAIAGVVVFVVGSGLVGLSQLLPYRLALAVAAVGLLTAGIGGALACRTWSDRR